jgi:hypothetical protein
MERILHDYPDQCQSVLFVSQYSLFDQLAIPPNQSDLALDHFLQDLLHIVHQTH